MLDGAKTKLTPRGPLLEIPARCSGAHRARDQVTSCSITLTISVAT